MFKRTAGRWGEGEEDTNRLLIAIPVVKVGARVLEFYVLKASLNSVYSQGTEGNKGFQSWPSDPRFVLFVCVSVCCFNKGKALRRWAAWRPFQK